MSVPGDTPIDPVDKAGSPRRRARYFRVWYTFARNSLVREMSFRANFLITAATRLMWFAAQVVLFELIYAYSRDINGWSKYQYFAFMATAMLVNAFIEMFFMANCINFSEHIRTGTLDFALLKPIDTQFLISLERIDLPVVTHVFLALGLLAYSLGRLGWVFNALDVLLYFAFVAVGVMIFYSVMLALTSTSVWMVRNRGLHEFWFYITVFARYPRAIYRGGLGLPLYVILSYFLPLLLVASVPAEVLANQDLFEPHLAFVAVLGAALCLLASRWVFNRALYSYRSASS